MSRLVLIIDDDPLQLKSLAKILESPLFDVQARSDAQEAIGVFDSHTVGAVVTDEHMPGMSGSELAAWIAKNHPNTKRIILTGRPNAETMMRAVNSGEVFRFLTKPCDPNQLRKAVREALEINELEMKDETLLEATRNQLCDIESHNRQLEALCQALVHDLGEPTRMVARFCQLLKDHHAQDLNEEGTELLGFAVDGALRIKEMLSTLLDYTHIHADAKSFQEVDLNTIVSTAVGYLRIPIEEAAAAIHVGILPTVYGNPSQLIQLFQNLLSNAVKFRSTATPVIQVTATDSPEGVVISVKDNGIGIPSQDTEHVFEVFRRLHTQEDYAGTGIGLAVCRRIADQHNATIYAESQPGVGSEFVVTFPPAAPLPSRESASTLAGSR